MCTAPTNCCPQLESTQTNTLSLWGCARKWKAQQPSCSSDSKEVFVQGNNASQLTSNAMSMQASQLRTILPVAVLLWLHQVTVSQNGVLEDAREGQWDRHSLRHNTSRLHAALPCMPSNVSQQQHRQSCMDRPPACAGNQRPQTAGRYAMSAA